MRVTSRETYKVVQQILALKKFTQYQLSKQTDVTFSLVNRVVNWFVLRGYVAKRTGYYELIAAGSVFSLFPLYRKMKPIAVFDVSATQKEIAEMIKGKSALCLTSAISFYDDFYRDPAVYLYALDEKLLVELKRLPKGYTRVEVFKEELNAGDFEGKGGQKITNKIRTVIDLFCFGKAYAAERLVKKEWM